MCRLSWNLGASTSWNPMSLSRFVMGLLYLYPLPLLPDIHEQWVMKALKDSLMCYLFPERYTALYIGMWIRIYACKTSISVNERRCEDAEWIQCGTGYGPVGYSTGQGPETSTSIKGDVLLNSSIIGAKLWRSVMCVINLSSHRLRNFTSRQQHLRNCPSNVSVYNML
jgi:hypothetical protein